MRCVSFSLQVIAKQFISYLRKFIVLREPHGCLFVQFERMLIGDLCFTSEFVLDVSKVEKGIFSDGASWCIFFSLIISL